MVPGLSRVVPAKVCLSVASLDSITAVVTVAAPGPAVTLTPGAASVLADGNLESTDQLFEPVRGIAEAFDGAAGRTTPPTTAGPDPECSFSVEYLR